MINSGIWDETLYKAWSSIVYMLIPNVKEMECSLNEFAEILDADEVPLYSMKYKKEMAADIVQFVPYREFKGNP